MEDQFFSVSCPNCKQSLLGPGIASPSFVIQGFCPFCGLTVKWARTPLLMVVFGILTFVLSFYIPQELLADIAVQRLVCYSGIAIGVATFLYGIFFFRIVPASSNSKEPERPGYYHPSY